MDEVVEEWKLRQAIAQDLRQEDPLLFPESTPEWDWSDLKVKPVWWSESWIPIGASGTPTIVCVDLDPAPAGTVGQLLIDDGMQEPRVFASGINEYFEQLIRGVEQGHIAFNTGWVKRRGDKLFEPGDFGWDQMIRGDAA